MKSILLILVLLSFSDSFSNNLNGLQNKKILLISSNIKSSLFITGIEQGLNFDTATSLINIYKSLGIDFKKDITPNSKLRILLEKDTENILYTELITNKETIGLYYYKLQNGSEGYLNKRGIGVKKDRSFIDPLNGDYRISSKFGNRKHPIHDRVTFHKGIDYATQFGTPIRAAADGTIDYLGNNGSYGKYIRIRHNNHYFTCYAHISKFHKNMKLGFNVKQGEVIAYVGSTGASTGPHLHYEVIYNGKHIDPLELWYTMKISISHNELKDFKAFMHIINQLLESLHI